MTLHTLPETVHQGPRAHCVTEHLDQQRRAQQDHLRQTQRLQGQRRALLTRQAAERATTAGHGAPARLLLGIRHAGQLVALTARAAVSWSGLDRREAVDFVARERLHAWGEGFRLPY